MKISGALKALIKKIERFERNGWLLEGISKASNPQNFDKAMAILKKRRKL